MDGCTMEGQSDRNTRESSSPLDRYSDPASARDTDTQRVRVWQGLWAGAGRTLVDLLAQVALPAAAAEHMLAGHLDHVRPRRRRRRRRGDHARADLALALHAVGTRVLLDSMKRYCFCHCQMPLPLPNANAICQCQCNCIEGSTLKVSATLGLCLRTSIRIHRRACAARAARTHGAH